MLRNVLLNQIIFFLKKKNRYSKEDNSSSYDSDEEECGAREVLLISQENLNDDHGIYKEDETDAEEDSQT